MLQPKVSYVPFLPEHITPLEGENALSRLTAIILTYNEEIHISRAIRSLQQCSAVDSIFVVDSFSTDRTVQIAEQFGAHVVRHPFVNQAKQFQWALDTLPIRTEWIMRLDADEVLGEDLAEKLPAAISEAPSSVTGFTLNRRHIFLGRWIKHGGRYPLRLLRVWRNGIGRVEDRWMDEHVVLREGTIRDLEGKFEDRNLNDIHFFTEKHNRYATREAVESLLQEYGTHPVHGQSFGLSSQARVKRILKERIYNRLPYQLTSMSYFLFRYFLQRGFLDGSPGLVYHFLQGFWYRFLVGAKAQEIRLAISLLPTTEARIAKLLGIAEGDPVNDFDKSRQGGHDSHE